MKPEQQVINDLIELTVRFKTDTENMEKFLNRQGIKFTRKHWMEQYSYFCLARFITLNEGNKI